MFTPDFLTMCFKCVTIKSNEMYSEAIPAYCAAYKICPCFAKGVQFLSYQIFFFKLKVFYPLLRFRLLLVFFF